MALLKQVLQRAVDGQHQVRIRAEDQRLRRDLAAAGFEGVELLDEHLGVDHHTVSDDAGGIGLKYAARDQVEDDGLAVDDQGVAGVISAPW